MRYELEKWLKRKGIDYSVESGDKLCIEFYDFAIIVNCKRDPYLLTTSIYDYNVDMDDQPWVADEQEFDSEMLGEMLKYIWYKKLESDDHKELDEEDEDEDCNKLIESRTISGEEFAELAKEIIRTKKNAYESFRRPSGRMLNEEGMDYDIYVVPEWTLPYLFNDDPSGLEEDEIEAVDKFVESIPNTVFSVVEDDNGEFYKFFARTNDLPGEHGRLGNECVELKVVRV